MSYSRIMTGTATWAGSAYLSG